MTQCLHSFVFELDETNLPVSEQEKENKMCRTMVSNVATPSAAVFVGLTLSATVAAVGTIKGILLLFQHQFLLMI